jgi:hypothetical protein
VAVNFNRSRKRDLRIHVASRRDVQAKDAGQVQKSVPRHRTGPNEPDMASGRRALGNPACTLKGLFLGWVRGLGL